MTVAEGRTPHGAAARAEEPETTSLREAWAHPAYRAAVAVNFAIGWAFFGVRMSLVPLFVTEGLHERSVWIGVGFLCYVGRPGQDCSWSPGGSSTGAGRRPAMVIGCLVVGGRARRARRDAVAAGVPGRDDRLGVGGAFVSTAPGAVVGDIMRGRGGKVVAVFQMAADAGTITGPLAAGWLADPVSFGAGFAVCGCRAAGRCGDVGPNARDVGANLSRYREQLRVGCQREERRCATQLHDDCAPSSSWSPRPVWF